MTIPARQHCRYPIVPTPGGDQASAGEKTFEGGGDIQATTKVADCRSL